MSKQIEEILDGAVSSISGRIAAAEEEYLRIAGERLKEIGSLSADEASEYLQSAYLGIKSDIKKVKKALQAAHKANVKEIEALYSIIKKAAPWSKAAKNKAVIKSTVALYGAIAASAMIDGKYRKAIGQLVNRMAGDENRILYASSMRKAIKELAENGIESLNPKTWQRTNLGNVIRANIRQSVYKWL